MAERTVVTKVSNATLFSDGTIKVENVRFSYPHLGSPYEGKDDSGNQTKRYTIVGMMPKKTHLAAKDLIKKVIEDMIKKEDVKIPKERWFLGSGDDKEQEEYADHWIIAAAESRRPSARFKDGSVMTPEEADEEIVGGYWGHVLIRPWYFSGKAKNGSTYPKRICAGLVGAQLIRTDETFGEGRVSDEGVFGNEDDGSSGGSNDDDDDL
jgi:hypothetical protein